MERPQQTKQSSKGTVALVATLALGALTAGAFLVPLFPRQLDPERALDSTQITDSDIKQFGQVHPYLLRGGTPSPEGIRKLKGLGVSTIIDLRREPTSIALEKNVAQSLGITHVSLPMGDEFPNADRYGDFTRIVEKVRSAPGAQAVFVHCNGGMDRTGTLVALWRITHDGWTVGAAATEMLEHGWFIHHLVGPPGARKTPGT